MEFPKMERKGGVKGGRMIKKRFTMLIGLGVLGILPLFAQAGNGSISFEGESVLRPTIDPIQDIDLSMSDITEMRQQITTGGSGVASSGNLTGTATGVGAGSLNMVGKTLMTNISGQSLDVLVGRPTPGNAPVIGGLTKGAQFLGVALGGAHSILGTVNGNGTITFATTANQPVTLTPAIDPIQNVDLSGTDTITMNQSIGAGTGASVSSIIPQVSGTATGSGTGILNIGAFAEIESNQVQMLETLVSQPTAGGAVLGGLSSGEQKLKTMLSGGHELIMVLR